MSIPPEAPQTISELANMIDWTWIISVFIVVIGAIVSFTKIFGDTISENKLRKSDFIKEMQKKSSTHETEISELRQKLTDAQADLKVQKVEVNNSKKTEEEIKRDYRELVNKMDELIRQIINLLK